MLCAPRLVIRTPIVHVNNIYTAVLKLRYVTNVHNVRHPFHLDCIFFFPPVISVSSNGQHTVCVPLHSLSFVPTLLILSVFPFVLLDKVKQLLWGRGNVIGLLLRVSTNYFLFLFIALL